MEIRPVGTALIDADGNTEERADRQMTNGYDEENRPF
jgi:hypothetical protein